MAYRLKRTFKEKKQVKVVHALSTKNSTLVHVNHHAVVAFLRKVNEVEFYYKGIKYNFAIDNDKEVLEIGEKAIAELIENYLKENGEKVIDEATGDIVLKGKKKGRKKKGEKLKEEKKENVEVKEKNKRGRPKKVK